MYSFESINKHRYYLFGIATFWIVMFHSAGVNFTSCDALSVLNTGRILEMIRRMGSCGVDIFLLLSGAGLFFSFTKDRNIRAFIKRRLIRILPVSFIVAFVVACLVDYSDARMFLLKITFLEYFFVKDDGLLFWFISAILLLYLLFPLFFKMIEKSKITGTAVIVLVSVVITVCLYIIDPELFSRFAMLTARVPAFIAGIIIGTVIQKEQKITKAGSLIMCLIGLVYFIYLIALFFSLPGIGELIKFYLYLPLSIFTVFFFTTLRNYISAPFLVSPVEYLGRHSLEVYLVHQSVYNGFYGKISVFDGHPLIYAFAAFTVSFILAVMVKKFAGIIVDKLSRRLSVSKQKI